MALSSEGFVEQPSNERRGAGRRRGGESLSQGTETDREFSAKEKLTTSLRLVFAIATLAMMPTVAAAESATIGLSDLFTEVESLALGAPVDAAPVYEIGRARLKPAADAKVRPLIADGRTCGFILEGTAEWIYRVEDRFIVPTVQHNLKSVRGLAGKDADGGLTIQTTITGAAVWGWDLGLEESGIGSTAEPIQEAAAPAWLRTVFEKKLTANPARGLVSSDRNGGAGFRWAAFDTSAGVLTLRVDPRAESREEALDRFVKPKVRYGPYIDGSFRTVGVATQPIGRAWWEAPQVAFASTNVSLSLSNPGGRDARIVSTTAIQAMRDDLKLLSFSLREAAYDERRAYKNRVQSVSVDGKPATWIFRRGSLLVELAKPLGSGESVTVTVETLGEIINRPSGDNYWRLVGNWYPVPAGGGIEWANFEFEVGVPESFLPIAPGEITERKSGDGIERVKSRVAGPMEYASVVAGKYKTVTDERDGFGVHVSAYAHLNEKDARRLSTVIHATKKCLEGWLGVPYPFPELQVVEVNSWGWGQAPPGIIYITQEAFNSAAKALVDDGERWLKALTSRNVNERVAHEVAHGWFPHVAKTATWEENWLSESLADYSSAVCIKQTMADKKKGKRSWERQLNDWTNLSRDAGDHASVFLAGHLGFADRIDGSTYRALLYGRGPLVLHKIRTTLIAKHGEKQGDQFFFAWLRSYMKNFDHKIAETRHLVAILNQITGEDWQPFFERYIYGTEHPEIG